ncbi:MAG TPA: AAA family ATPase [Pseudonocardiaceae bacterium]|nr:AAA family ATPase [Pseudonocardiaceae bacterium]
MTVDLPMAGPFISVRETHIGVVLLIGEWAYKLKKPVRTPFLDFSTRQRRLAACRREVELNRRLAPDVYLGVAEVTGVDGQPCEHLVVMRRMPDDRRLATLLAIGAPVADPVRRLAKMVATFHAGARRGPEITAEGGRDALRARWQEGFEELARFRGTVLDAELAAELERRALDFLDGREPLLAARQRAGRIVDGHGDLLTGDIFCLDDGPQVLDCLEFDDRLRYVDGLDDAAFLAMDLEYRGAPELGAQFMDWYAEFAGDPAPLALRHHYVAYRAAVRAKVACLRSEQGDAVLYDESRVEAGRYAGIAARHLRAAGVRLVLVGGLPGTGKSTVSGALAGELGMVALSSDRVRKELHGLAPHQSAAAPYEQGLYCPAATERTYTELLARAARCLGQGESVVLDASWTHAAHRAAAAELARRAHAELVALQCTAPSEVVAQRLRERTGSVSDADEAIGRALAAHADPWPQAAPIPTGGSVSDALAAACLQCHQDSTRESPLRDEGSCV